ncbi:hypothetical protein KY334_01520 [Candidatus Woesearchaeota archaeon]|nr:hypothetical protein [Candidatus Woesearchaeota archaeon]
MKEGTNVYLSLKDVQLLQKALDVYKHESVDEFEKSMLAYTLYDVEQTLLN